MQECKKHPGEEIRTGTMCNICREEADAEQKNETRKQIILSGDFMSIPKRFRSATLGDFNNYYDYRPRESVLLTGNCGLGKTHLAVALAKKAFLLSKDTLTQKGFFNFTVIGNKVKSSFHDKSVSSMESIVNEICKVPFCILDDIGITGDKGTAFEALYVIVNERYENMLPTIYTTNLTLEGLQELYGDRIASRLSSCKRIALKGDDRRLQK